MDIEHRKIQLLGLAPSVVAVQLSLLRERFKNCEFHIYKNIKVPDEPDLSIGSSMFHIEIHPLGATPGCLESSTDLTTFGVPGPAAKEHVFKYFQKKAGIEQNCYHTFIHSSAYVSDETEIGYGVFVEPGVVISTQTKVEFGVNLKRGVLLGHHNSIGRYSEINPGVVLSGNVDIGEKTVLGTGAVVKDGVSIGANTLIGMGSNVIDDIPSGVVAFGNPCRVVRKKDL